MKSRRLLWSAIAVAAGCNFNVTGLPPTSTSNADLATMQPDMPSSSDLASPCDPKQCPFGCSTAANRCANLQPSGVASSGDYQQPGLSAVVAAGDVMINTDTGQISGGVNRPMGSGVMNGIGFRSAPQNGAVAVGIFSVAGWSLPAGRKMLVSGSAAFALVSSGAVTLDGVVDGSCVGGKVGPGGSAGAMPTGGMAGGNGSGTGAGGGGGVIMATGGSGAGGGGAGYGDVGGNGSGAINGATAGAKGPIWGDLTPAAFLLVGGSGGGGGGNGGGNGGPGGGALQFSVDGDLHVGGTIHVGGCGGRHGGGKAGGGGGGSGGAIVLEAATIAFTSATIVAANGGGGGGGDGGGDGSDATPDANQAAGGSGAAPGGNGGARGPTAGLQYTAGVSATDVSLLGKGGGGGGGGVGRIAIHARMGGLTDPGATFSPDGSDLNANQQHPTIYGAALFQ